MAAITVENISKKYHLGVIGHGMFFKDMQSKWTRFFGKKDPHARINKDRESYVWALKDVSFEIKQGEKFGIIGPNGAGKSTLLKIISRITLPTAGVIRIDGPVASLLGVGVGFHPDLTGKDNIFLNAAIFGMKKQEIKEKFDSIVDFSELEKFIYTPVKRYSSGMYVKLAFSIAAHIRSSILVIDEVLSVGDNSFQAKCLGKMNELSAQGRTILFVSHNMENVKKLCSKGMLLKNGQVHSQGSIEKIVKEELSFK